jgi:hypothetical protein
MRKIYFLLFCSFLLSFGTGWGQQLLVQDFNFSGALTANGWTAHSGGGTNAVSTTTGLSFAGYAGSGVGNAALVGNAGGEDVNITFTSQNTNGQSIYYAFLVNVTDAATSKSGDYFFNTGSPGGASWTAFGGRVFARIVSGNINFGLSNTGTATWGATNFAKNTTYLLVMKYTISTSGNDPVSLWVLPSSVPVSEAAAGTPEVTNTTTGGTDAVNTVALRQGSSINQPQTVVDGIRVGTTWTSAVENSSAATISPSTATLSGFTYIQGSGPSASQNFTVSASNLSPAADNITVTGTTNYEVSADNSTWTGSFTIPYTGGALSATTVYVRLKAGLSAGTYNGENIAFSGGGATSSVTANGSVTAGSPVVSAAPTSLTGFTTSQGTPSAAQSFTVDGNNLTTDVVVTAPTDFEVSLSSGSGYGTSVTITQTGGTIASTTVYVRIRASAAVGSPAGNVTVTATGAVTQNVAVSGTVNPSPTITVTPTSLTGFSSTQGTASASQSADISGSTLTNDITVTAPANFEVSLDNTTFSSSVTLTQAGGTVNATPVYIRLKANAMVGSPSGNVTAASAGATTRTVAVSGTVAAGTAMAFTPGNLAVYRVGDGSVSLTSAAAPVYIDEFTPAGNLVQTIVLPTTASGSNRAITASGNATTEGLITRSTDKKFLMVTGYDAAVGTASVNTSASATVNRVVGRISSSSAVDATTALTDFASGGNPRGVASTNGTDIWVTSSTDGLKYTTLGATTTTQLATTPTNLRAVGIFDNQLYITSGSGSIRIATAGSGTPTTAGQTITNVPGSPTTGSPYQFFFADLDAGVAGVDVLYVADDGSGSGFQKYSLVSGTWTANGNIAVSGNSLRGLTGTVSGTTVTLYGTNGSSVVSLTDASGYNATITGTVTVLGTAGTNMSFRGLALTPESGFPMPVRFTRISATQKGSQIQVDWTNATEENVTGYTIERSANGRHFTPIGNIAARSNNNDKVDYNYIDASPLSGDNFYRVKATEDNGKVVYTNVVRISTGKKGTDLVVYPNPVKGADLNMQLSHLPAGKYTLRVFSMSGQVIDSRMMNHAGGSISETLTLKNLKPGLYTLQVSGSISLQKTFLAE